MRRFFRIVVTMAMLAIWPVAAMHCKLESWPGLEFLRCDVDAGGDEACADDDCVAVEDAAYKAPDGQALSPAPLVLALCLALETWRVDEPILVFSAPPEIPAGWQFSFRAASSPRAPSIAS